MTFNQLRTFVAVVDAGSVSDAAIDLLVSPPAVSAALATLQAELGVALVARAGRGLEITPAGRVFDSYARRVLQMVDEGVAATRDALDPETGRVRLAAVTTAGEHVLPRFLASFRARHPHAEVSLEVGNRERLWQMLGEREVDLAIGGRPPRGGRFVTRATRTNVLVLVAAAAPHPDKDGPHADGDVPLVREVEVEELARQVLLLREPGSGTRSTALELYEELGITPAAALTLGSNGALRESVQVGLGITLISRDAVARELDEGTLEEWRCPTLPRHRAWHLVSRAGEDLSATAGLFLSHVTADPEEGFVMVRHPAAG
ncbi:MAG: LysR family transcriptional regulator, low CO2-responsive transcriptional regulator [Actinomycetota bacterium]|jgi:DNA-binding transcriptional LysR family regulator|nr:LysR family transcriptional regulator, low CO2-responsive transcriptional regulator [Actinomycetota bacterium]